MESGVGGKLGLLPPPCGGGLVEGVVRVALVLQSRDPNPSPQGSRVQNAVWRMVSAISISYLAISQEPSTQTAYR